jgi:hypothetical protein
VLDNMLTFSSCLALRFSVPFPHPAVSRAEAQIVAMKATP